MRLPLFIFIALLSLMVSGVKAADTTIPGGQDLLIFYSNDVIGETEPCG
jgi:hypothetical protein